MNWLKLIISAGVAIAREVLKTGAIAAPTSTGQQHDWQIYRVEVDDDRHGRTVIWRSRCAVCTVLRTPTTEQTMCAGPGTGR